MKKLSFKNFHILILLTIFVIIGFGLAESIKADDFRCNSYCTSSGYSEGFCASGCDVACTSSSCSYGCYSGWGGRPCEYVGTCYCRYISYSCGCSQCTASGCQTSNYTLTVSKSPVAGGTVSGSGISCGSTCSASYSSGAYVTLTASAATGYTFSSWSGCDSTSGVYCYVTMNSNRSVTASFSGSVSYTLTVSKSPVAGGTVSGSGISCGSTCSASYSSGTYVTLTASAASGYTFSSWSGCDSTSGVYCYVTMNSSRSVTASFSILGACSDTDGGKNYNTRGTCTDNVYGSKTDSCISSEYLTEYYCDSGYCNTENWVYCPCGCSNGACQACVCTDTDGGNNGCVRGTCTDSLGRSYTDYCSGSNVIEYYCSLNNCLSQTLTYSYGCYEGQCITGSCYDSDGAQNYYASGYCRDYVGGSQRTLNDYCQCNPATYAFDYYCQNNACVSSAMDCGYGLCQGNGICATVSYTLAVNISGSGTVTGSGISCPGDCSESYTLNTNVTLTASAGTGYTFSGWSGCDSTSGAYCYVTMSSSKNVYAYFTASSYTLTASKNITAAGTITSSPSGINCGTSCPSQATSYSYNTSVTLTASAASGYTFSSWSGCDSTSGAYCYVTMNSAKSVTANFTANSYALDVNRSPADGGTVSGSGISCPGDCSESYALNTNVTLTASVASGYTFSSWVGCDSTNGVYCYVTMNSYKNVTAYFASSFYTLTVNISGSGTVTGSGISCPGDCSESYTLNTNVTLTASAASGYTFSGWYGCDSAYGNTCYVTMNSAKSVTAYFTAISYTLNTYISGSGTVTGSGISCPGDCSESYALNTNVTLTASPGTGYYFSSWSGCDSTSGANCYVTMSSSKNVYAYFNLSNRPPQIIDMSLGETPCTSFKGKTLMTFSWRYFDPDGDEQSKFEFKITSENDPYGEVVIQPPPNNNPSSDYDNQVFFVSVNPILNEELSYDQHYYWWAKVWDDQGNDSGWVGGPNQSF